MDHDFSRVVDALSEAREDRFQVIVESLPALVCLLKPAGGVALVNRCCREFFGATLEEMRTWELADIVHPDDLPAVTAAWNGAVETGLPYEVEGRYRRADGVYRWLHMRAVPLRDADERIVLWCLVQTDIDDRKRAEALLSGERHLLEMVASGRPLQVVLDALCRLLDASADGCSSSVLLSDTTHTRVQHPMAPAHGPMSCWSSPILSLTGEPLGTLAICQRTVGSPTPFHEALIQRLTHIASIAIERTQRDAVLKRSEAFLAKAQHLSSTGGFSWRVETDEITWSDQVYRIFELDPAAPVTLASIGTRLHPEDIPSFQEMLVRQRRDGSDFEHEHRLLMPDHSVKYLRVVAHATWDQDGQLVYIAAVQDVTERRLSDEALGKARSDLARVARITTLGALTASIAHEVNQPLSGIVTNASTCLRMLAADPPNVDGARETARRTIRDGHRASDVIARLRALFANKDATTDLVDLNEATREVIALSSSELQRARVTLRAELDEDLPPVAGDRVQLQQVILNLLLNAADAMSGVDDRPKQAVIRTERDVGDGVRLTVQDAGVGFEPQGMDKLFEAFYTTKSGGMGIGLSVSRSIIESHHGRLWAAPNDGPGATFAFSLPRGSEGGSGAHSPGVVRAPALADTAHAMRNL